MRVDTRRANELLAALQDVHSVPSWDLVGAVIETVAAYTLEENRAEALELAAEAREGEVGAGRGALPRGGNVQGDPVLLQAYATAAFGAAPGLVRLLAHVDDHEEVVGTLITQASGCHPGCPGHEYTLRHIGAGSPIDRSLEAGDALCHLNREGGLERIGRGAYTRFLDEHVRAPTGAHLVAAASVLAESGRSREGLDETYYRLVLDGASPREALQIAEALQR